jgi:hypothetical protein
MMHMKMRFLLPAVAALTLLIASPASAQIYARYGYAPQGGGGAGPYALQCRGYRNFQQRQRCTTLSRMRWHHRHHYRHHHRRHHHHHRPAS